MMYVGSNTPYDWRLYHRLVARLYNKIWCLYRLLLADLSINVYAGFANFIEH